MRLVREGSSIPLPGIESITSVYGVTFYSVEHWTFRVSHRRSNSVRVRLLTMSPVCKRQANLVDNHKKSVFEARVVPTPSFSPLSFFSQGEKREIRALRTIFAIRKSVIHFLDAAFVGSHEHVSSGHDQLLRHVCRAHSQRTPCRPL